jgi:hypothetical protein
MAALAFTLFESFNRASGIDTELAFARLLFSHILPFITHRPICRLGHFSLEVWCLSYMSENYFGGYVTTQQK